MHWLEYIGADLCLLTLAIKPAGYEPQLRVQVVCHLWGAN